jgi:hypothetical protein
MIEKPRRYFNSWAFLIYGLLFSFYACANVIAHH